MCRKIFVQVMACCHGNPIFKAMFSQILTFLMFYSFNSRFLQTTARYLPQIQEIENLS